MSRNEEFSLGHFNARNHTGGVAPTPMAPRGGLGGLKKTQMQKVMQEGSPESQARLKKTMGKTDARSGGWAGHMPGPMDPYSNMAGEVARAWESGSNYGEIDPRPIKVTKPKKHFKPKGMG